MTSATTFTAARRAALREEILREGLVADQFLAADPNVATFGLNLACSWPFPESWRTEYERMAERLRAQGPWLYVYPFEHTHVTLVTLLSFARHTWPSPDLVKSLESIIPPIEATLASLFVRNSAHRIQSFRLQPCPLVLARAAGFLPLLNPDGEVRRLRQQAQALLARNEWLYPQLVTGGLNVPGILHSTILRFYQPPPDLDRFLAAFDDIVAEVTLPPFEVKEALLTSETQPYMRRGEILQRYSLEQPQP